MKDGILSSARLVDDPRSASFFTSSRMRRILMMFARDPLSVREAASRSGIELKRLHYYVGRLQAAGLLEIASSRARAGRPIKLYRTAAQSFFIPNEALPNPSTDEIARELRELLQADEAQASAGILVSLGANMEPKVEFITSEDRSRNGFELWRILRLRRDEFDRLRADLDAVLQRYQASHDERGHVYLVHAAGAPRTHSEGVVDNRLD